MVRFQSKHTVWVVILILYGLSTVYYIALTNSRNFFRLKNEVQKEIALQASKSFHGTVADVQNNVAPTQKVGSSSKYSHPLYPGFPLSGDLANPIPGFKLGHASKQTKVVIGIPTIQREGISYLHQTIDSLLKNIEPRRNDTAIVIYIGELDTEFVRSQAREISENFPNEVEDGTLQVISPPLNFYPDWEEVLPPSFGDPKERIKWRSKQNLDQIFLMMYIYHMHPAYYLMLEDDVLSSVGYMDSIIKHAESIESTDYFFVSFCSLGAIGKLFRARTLPSYAAFIHIFWNRKPLDWLQIDYVGTEVCSYDESQKECFARRKEYMKEYRPALFQHIGRISSLKGKQQLLKDNSFVG
uniref:Alpha-1,3-mannosyl-glycoprotein 4-beta-N-acetylglucosaminyltransferase A n=1 Tax=Ciona intestinalis TaxID=7719 RepID=F6XPI1_CIOIN|nr:alpha-1,3-mannosyl-glycoprotein 4-beta-N-acetylglucosaminyltransferase A isoform X1 [Ciona intestinalis]|eukprot:XP_002127140.1 alpha-1,3-mannosyl-glycoprotein 4-beta-N-acetylglucosaminyltransferase A isoform X1 [Ciona intestinalis]